MKPDLIADATFYATENGGKTIPALSGYGCVCMVSKEQPREGWSARMLFDGEPIRPGQRRRVGFAFLLPEAVGIFVEAPNFFVWEGRIVGEAIVCAEDD